MNILFITPSLPNRLHRNRSFTFVKYLSRKHNVYLLSLTFDKEGHREFEELKKYCAYTETIYKPKWRAIFDALLFTPTSLPLEIGYCRSAEMEKRIPELIKKFSIDFVYVKRLRSAQFFKNFEVPHVLDSTDAMSMFYQRALQTAELVRKPLFLEEWFKYKAYEKETMEKFKNWVVCSPVDADYLQQLAPKDVNIHIIPNGVDMEYFDFSDQIPQNNTLILSGLLNKFVNIQAAQYFINDVFPLILKEIPDTRLYLVGPAGKAAKKLAADNIFVTDYVKDLREYIRKSQLVICPLKTGAGTKFKILQAWSMGRPAVTTSTGNEGLDGKHGKDIMVANKPAEFASAVITLLKNKRKQEELVRNGHAFVKNRYSMEVVAERLNGLLENLGPVHK